METLGETQANPPTTIVRNLVILTLITVGAVASVFLFGAYNTVKHLSTEAIETSSKRSLVELRGFFSPLSDNLLVLHDWGSRGALSLGENPDLNLRLIPLLQRHPSVTSLLIANTEGQEYLLLKDGEHWVNRRVDSTKGKTTHWQRWTADGQLLESWTRELDYASDTRPWYQGAITQNPGEVHWTHPYIFFTSHDIGMTASTQVKTPNGQTLIVAFDVKLSSISEFTSKLDITPNGVVAVVSPAGRVIGLPRGEAYAKDPNAYLLQPIARLKIPVLELAWGRTATDATKRIMLRDGDWWVGINAFRLGDKDLRIIVAVPNDDFIGDIRRQQALIVFIGILALLLAVAVGVWTTRNVQSKLTRAVRQVQRIGQYSLDRRIGSGGMGEVFKANHAMLRRPTALKLIKPDADPRSIQNFEREVRLTASLTHPNTIIIYDYGQTPEGIFYYAMEYLKGVNLCDLVKHTGPVPAARVLHILEQICESLDEAHRAGLIHRDVKPANVFLCERGGKFDFVKVLDFGLVREIDATISGNSITSLQGTPGYMAPETAEEDFIVQPTVDIYGLGAIAYLLLAGSPAFEGNTNASIFVQQLSEDPVPPSKKLGAPLPADLEGLVMQCLNRSPQHRPSSMAAVLMRIRTCQDFGLWTEDHAERWWSRHTDLLIHEESDPTIDTLKVDIGSRDVKYQSPGIPAK